MFSGVPDFNGNGVSDETDDWAFSLIMNDVVDDLPIQKKKKKNNKKQIKRSKI